MEEITFDEFLKIFPTTNREKSKIAESSKIIVSGKFLSGLRLVGYQRSDNIFKYYYEIPIEKSKSFFETVIGIIRK